MIEQLLTSLHLVEEEAQTYLKLLEFGPTTVGNIAKKVGVPRPSLYGYLKRLEEKGLVAQSLRGGIKTFGAEPLEKIELLFQQHIEDLTRKQQEFVALVPELKKHLPTHFIKPTFHMYEGIEGLKHALKDMLLYRDLATEAFWPIEEMIDVLGKDFFVYLNIHRIKQNLYTRALWPASKNVNFKQFPFLGVGAGFKREIRRAPVGVETSMGYWAYANKVVFIASRKESIGFLIESAELRQLLKTQFDSIWNLSKPIKVNSTDTEAFLKKIE